MNLIGHYRDARKSNSIWTSILSILPDIFVVLRKIGLFKETCLKMHNTEEGIDRVPVFLKKAWRLHMKQDMTSHAYKYGFSDLIPKDSVLLLSGGLDSFVQWRLLGFPKAVYFKIGHKYESKELEMIGRMKLRFSDNIIIDSSLDLGVREMDNAYIPFRNLLFIAQASHYSSNIIICQIAEWAPDKNKSFYRKTEKMLKECGSGTFQGIKSDIKIYSPFAGYTKTKLVAEYIKNYNPSDLTDYTVSCYSEDDVNCGKCTACVSRYVAMENNEIHEKYQTVPSVTAFQKKLSIKDFKINLIPMYIKRWKEFKQFATNQNRIHHI